MFCEKYLLLSMFCVLTSFYHILHFQDFTQTPNKIHLAPNRHGKKAQVGLRLDKIVLCDPKQRSNTNSLQVT